MNNLNDAHKTVLYETCRFETLIAKYLFSIESFVFFSQSILIKFCLMYRLPSITEVKWHVAWSLDGWDCIYLTWDYLKKEWFLYPVIQMILSLYNSVRKNFRMILKVFASLMILYRLFIILKKFMINKIIFHSIHINEIASFDSVQLIWAF